MRTEVLNVKGMTCGGCTSAVTKALKATRGVEDVTVDLGKGQVMVRFDPVAAPTDELRGAVTRAGFEAVGRPSRPETGGGCCGCR